MIIKEFNLLGSIKKDEFQSFLIYGPNEGLVKEIIENIYKEFSDNETCEKINLHGKQLDEDVSVLNNEIGGISMFSSKKFIVLESIKDKHSELIESILDTKVNDVCVIIKSDNLNKTSKIRKMYESSKAHMSLACYNDDLKSISSVIEKFQKENQIYFDRDIKNYLLQNLSSDRSVIKTELEKIILSLGDVKDEIKIENIRSVLHDSAEISFQQINNSILFGKTEKSSKSVTKLMNEGTSPIAILKSFNNYLLRIRTAQLEMKKGKSFDEAIKSLKPPIFWKEKSDFQSHCKLWSGKVIERIITDVLKTEIDCMQDHTIAREKCELLLYQVAYKSNNYTIS